MPRATEEHTTPAADPLIAIGEEIYRLDERDRECQLAEEMGRGDESEQAYLEEEERQIVSQAACLRAYATTLQATSIEGALVQLSVAFELFEELANNKLDNAEILEFQRRFRRCMYSAIRPIAEAGSDVSLTEIGVHVHMEENLDPWRSWEQLVGIARARRQADMLEMDGVRQAQLRTQVQS